MQKNMILPCILSGLFGAVFYSACEIGKSNADSILTKTVYEGNCEGEDDLLPEWSGEEQVQIWLSISGFWRISFGDNTRGFNFDNTYLCDSYEIWTSTNVNIEGWKVVVIE